jgi:hypothetical protein
MSGEGIAILAAAALTGLAALQRRGSRALGDYAYHATSPGRLSMIQRRGLLPRVPSGMDHQPEGVYFAPSEDTAGYWNEVLLRFPWPQEWEDDTYGTTTYIDDELVSSSMWTPHEVLPEDIEVKIRGQWRPLVGQRAWP